MSVPVPLQGPDLLHDAHRVAAARRLLVEVPGPAAFDRLSGLAARLLGAGHAKVTIFTDQDTVVGGHGLPPGVVGGPALLTGQLSARVVRDGRVLVVPDGRCDERVADLPAVTSGAVVAYLGAPLVSASGRVVGALAVYDTTPRAWHDDDAALLEHLAASVVAELELSAARSAIGASLARLDVALEASSVGIWEHDPRTGVVSWDERCAAVHGLEGAQEFTDVDRMLAERIHPDDHAAVRAAMAEAFAGTGEYVVECRALHADGGTRWTVSRGRVVRDVRGEAVRVLGTVVDVTEAREQADRRMAAVQRAAAVAQVAAELANATALSQLAEIALRGARVLGASSSALAAFDRDGTLRLHLGQRLADTVAAAAAEADVEVDLGERGVVVELDDELPTQYAAHHGERFLFADLEEAVARFPRMAEVGPALGVRAMAALPLRVEGRLLGSFVVVWDTEHAFADTDAELLDALTAQIATSVSRMRSRAERAAAEAELLAANRRLQLLAEAGQVLSGSLDITEQLDRLAGLVVPALADWCWIVVTEEQGRLQEVAWAHRDPARREDVAAYVRAMVPGMSDEHAARVVTRTGRPLVVPDLDPERIARSLPDPAARETLLRLEPRSALIVPLVARGHVIGALGTANGAERGPHTPEELETAVEVGRRAGLALQSARLYAQQRDLAEVLQHSMLTAPPRPPGCEIVVRYRPASEGAEIGGDWYDAFVEAGGHTVLAIGDVVGHDRHAAAVMGQLRGLLRGIAYAGDPSPAEALTRLDRAAVGLDLGAMATAVVARLERQPGQPALLRWSSAGHPPPVVVDPDGGVRALDPGHADLLLGVDPDRPRTDCTDVLPVGSTVLLHTDGLVERRDRDLDAGTAELVAVLRDAAGLPLEELCDRVLARLFLPDAEDDVALLAVRVR
ncbi:PAS domain S-box-containing protein [Geodermatophilus tzadiensis]|uniref:PAS domain S-box-containing protein n=1 Tax=Geodermatophilus tzadiensis TaxID=1137988 RepID=A0A2T0TFC8_9ACTN|nr:SpoIIE family protein phosphatase [Geodermatophilus tzadiensis]PRY44353.1 PAS domain S-box-containing protein [Geodermatophilus tzadiensis]